MAYVIERIITNTPRYVGFGNEEELTEDEKKK
jgi:hypothetical protein